MTIKYNSAFLKHYRKRIQPHQALKNRFDKRIKIFVQDKNNPLLHNHQLSGDLEGFCTFSITGDIRVIYKFESKDIVLFYDIGTHNQVYK